ncbi:hypothetical protein JI435_406040 [Parastagonospora nodorum SN15]|uniref:Uncharacterized protein n=1 Tax=Phaeosphaeria nodorum (strain SN15 / ATCC MYA-4574 / FGSC 10173) TaxID=321614 RepID=A0A7U2EWT5_PHANO|nr:hypothetical protein HBH89_254240 [Parastagonospora nodorum]QRC94571.1 hypothetical protein JI435_406040 [Parastagonospora nodorum SN15]
METGFLKMVGDGDDVLVEHPRTRNCYIVVTEVSRKDSRDIVRYDIRTRASNAAPRP